MRRAIPALLAAGVLLAAGACGAGSGTTGVTTTVSAPPPADPATAAACEALARAYGKHMAPFAQALSGVVADGKATEPAQRALADFAAAVQAATEASTDAEIRADGKRAADQMRATSADAKFFAGIKTAEDADRAMGQTLTGWLAPLSRHCS
ncbi:hypothetical protein QLQ12_10110 [Actinoplanes sp. NEAU-A12]|uniref:Lipoprotein n=1 Tax=Actinoplanes sandaracinus TaxID=3045177 RepID=A0ABT6WGV5_9ACTN|nr:hypothetical protein [Actinoplanes sandaracinus]MDI6098953.1 hypothetical protein [Actinoplanes sandaracinus]